MLRTELIRPLIERLRENAVEFPEKTAFADARRSVAWADLDQRTARVAGHLGGLGVEPADRVLIYLNDCVEAVETYLTVLRAGAISAPVHTGLEDRELGSLLADSKAKAVFTDATHLAQVCRLRTGFPNLVVVLVDNAEESAPADCELPVFSTLATTEPASPPCGDLGLDDLAFLTYTAGTTGSPRGVLFSQRNVMWAIAACYAPILGLCAEDRVCCPLPLAEGLAQQVGVIGVVTVGATGWVASASADNLGDLITQRSGFVNELVEQGITFLAGMPATFQDLLWAADGRHVDAPELRTCLVAGSSGVTALREAFEDAFGVRLLDSYMTTETTGPVTVSWPSGERMDAACGLPIPGIAVRVIDPRTGADSGIGQEGEIWVSGPNVTAGGYHNQPGASAAAITHGWYHTGDLARRDDLGYVTITGRMSEVITRGADVINPREIENLLLGVRGVAAAVVIGELDQAMGEVPVAYLKAGPDGLDATEIFATCRRQLSTVKVPVALYRVDEIPRARAGRVARKALREVEAELVAVLPAESSPGKDTR
ncbi:MAG TPA: class I adenylate-forming enzyme family protein [Actinophytocola sp.]|jgi:acyl-CoA synthetase (AMP-forming)/AMP-acid ligase II|nr:class I adenylate-forming enzyme family protein [Actinophytocola sp.]